MQNDDTTLKTYITELKKLRERKLLKEVYERDMLLVFIRANMERIAEFPLLETEQDGIISILAQRASDHPCQELFHTWLNTFLNTLNHYSKALDVKDGVEDEETEQLKRLLYNAESVLIQCVQGVVYAVGLAKDNSSHALVSALGVDALAPLQEMTKEIPADERYWRAVLQRLFIERIETAYEQIIEQKLYTLSKDESLVVLRFHLDDVFRQSGASPVEVELTRIQDSFESVLQSEQGRENLSCVTRFLQSAMYESVRKELGEKELPHAAQIACMDKLASRLCAFLAGTPKEEDTLREGELASDRRKFLEEQTLAMAVGAVIATNILKQDILRALKELGASELHQISESMGNLERPRILPTISTLYELYFIHYLRQQLEEDASKVQLRTQRTRRISRKALEPLSEAGLTRIRQKKLFTADEDSDESLLFVPRTASDLQKLVQLLQIEGELMRMLLQLWRDAPMKVDLLAVINLKQLARLTTNLPQRVGEILSRFGILLR